MAAQHNLMPAAAGSYQKQTGKPPWTSSQAELWRCRPERKRHLEPGGHTSHIPVAMFMARRACLTCSFPRCRPCALRPALFRRSALVFWVRLLAVASSCARWKVAVRGGRLLSVAEGVKSKCPTPRLASGQFLNKWANEHAQIGTLSLKGCIKQDALIDCLWIQIAWASAMTKSTNKSAHAGRWRLGNQRPACEVQNVSKEYVLHVGK